MAETQTASTSKPSRKTLRAAGRAKRKVKLATDKGYAKTYFEGKSKRAADKKAGYRKKKKGKK